MPEAREASGRPKSYPRWLGVVGALMLSMLVAVVLLTLEPLEPLPASAPTDEFSAERAFFHVDRIAQRPHPVGSEANTEVRKYLLRQLVDLGLRPTAEATTAAQMHPDGTTRWPVCTTSTPGSRGRTPPATSSSSPTMTRCRTLPGPRTTGPGWPPSSRSHERSPRVLRRATTSTSCSPTPRSPACSARRRSWTRDGSNPQRSVVLNLEARGTSGPAIMFETNPDNANVVPALASAQRPIAGSETAAIYRLLPNDTDFTVFDRDGFAGMNFAFVDGSAHYHTPGDSPSNLDPSSLQHMGSTVLDAARYFARQDLDAPRGGQLTYSSVLGQLVYYPQGLAVPLSVLAAVAFAATVLYARRRGLRVRAVAWRRWASSRSWWRPEGSGSQPGRRCSCSVPATGRSSPATPTGPSGTLPAL